MPIKTKKVIKKKPVKKVVKKKVVKKEKLVGKVSHYFSNIKVGVIKLKDSLSVGDKIRIVGGEDTDFKQTVKSMEKDRKKLKKAKEGTEVGMKIKEKVREGYKMFKI